MQYKINLGRKFFYSLFIFLFIFLVGCGGGSSSGDVGGYIPSNPTTTATPDTSEGLKASLTAVYGDQSKTILIFTGLSFGSLQGKVNISNLTSVTNLKITKWTDSEIQVIIDPSVLAIGKYFFTIDTPYSNNSPSQQFFFKDFNIISPKLPFIESAEFIIKPTLGAKIDTILIKGHHFWSGLTPPGNIKFFIYHEGAEPIPLTIKNALTDKNGDQITATPASPFLYKGNSISIKGVNEEDAYAVFSLPVPQLGKVYSVFIGINNYQNISDLSCCVADAVSMQSAFDTGSLNDLWDSGIKTPIHDASATKTEILKAIDNISSQMTDSDVFFMYYSGHGTTGKYPPLPGSEGYICPVDCISSDLKTSISSTELKNLLLKMPEASTKIICLDSCFSGGFIGKSPSSLKAKYFKFEDTAKIPPQTGTFKNIGLAVQNYFFLTSSSYSEVSWEDTDLGHGLFTWGLLAALGIDGSTFGSAFKEGNCAILIQDTYDEAARITRLKASETSVTQTPQFFTNPEKENFPIKGNLK